MQFNRGEKRIHDGTVDAKEPGKRVAQHEFCCVNPWTSRCEHRSSAESRELSLNQKEAKCFPTENACVKRCNPPLLPDLLNITLQYAPVVVKDAFDVKNDEKAPVLSQAEIKAQADASVRLDDLLTQIESWPFYEQDYAQGFTKQLDLIQSTLVVLHNAVTVEQLKRIIALQESIFDFSNNQRPLLIKKYLQILRFVPQDAEFLTLLFLQIGIKKMLWDAEEENASYNGLQNILEQPKYVSLKADERALQKYSTRILKKFTQDNADHAVYVYANVEQVYDVWKRNSLIRTFQSFPLNFVLALFAFLIKHQSVSVFPWVDLVHTLFKRNDISETTGRWILALCRKGIAVAFQTPLISWDSVYEMWQEFLRHRNITVLEEVRKIRMPAMQHYAWVLYKKQSEQWKDMTINQIKETLTPAAKTAGCRFTLTLVKF